MAYLFLTGAFSSCRDATGELDASFNAVGCIFTVRVGCCEIFTVNHVEGYTGTLSTVASSPTKSGKRWATFSVFRICTRVPCFRSEGKAIRNLKYSETVKDKLNSVRRNFRKLNLTCQVLQTTSSL